MNHELFPYLEFIIRLVDRLGLVLLAGAMIEIFLLIAILVLAVRILRICRKMGHRAGEIFPGG